MQDTNIVSGDSLGGDVAAFGGGTDTRGNKTDMTIISQRDSHQASQASKKLLDSTRRSRSLVQTPTLNARPRTVNIPSDFPYKSMRDPFVAKNNIYANKMTKLLQKMPNASMGSKSQVKLVHN